VLTRVLLFDAGNTIIELDYAALAAICTRHGAAVNAATMEEAVVRIRPELDEFMRTPSSSTESTDTREFMLRSVYARLGIDREKQAPITGEILAVLQSLWSHPTRGAGMTLTALHKRGHVLGVVSNSDGTVDQQIEQSGLAHHFEVIVDSGTVGVEKPDPEIFAIALRALQAHAAEATYFGDMPSVDVVGALRAGIAPVLIDPLDLFPDVTCRRIHNLPDLLADRSG